MAVSYGKGDKGKATKLHAEVTRMYGACEACGKDSSQVQLQCAHINSRRFSSTRTLLINAYSLCAGCHRFYTDHPREFSRFITRTWHQPMYDLVYQMSRATTAIKTDFTERLEFLKQIKKDIESGDITVDDARKREYKLIFES